jgi:hypothetical protein
MRSERHHLGFAHRRVVISPEKWHQAILRRVACACNVARCFCCLPGRAIARLRIMSEKENLIPGRSDWISAAIRCLLRSAIANSSSSNRTTTLMVFLSMALGRRYFLLKCFPADADYFGHNPRKGLFVAGRKSPHLFIDFRIESYADRDFVLGFLPFCFAV